MVKSKKTVNCHHLYSDPMYGTFSKGKQYDTIKESFVIKISKSGFFK